MHPQLYTFRAVVTNVVDGDTLDCDIDVGFKVHMHQRVRLHGVNTPELRSRLDSERFLAREAMAFVKSAVLGKEVYIQTYKDDVFGRYLARVYFHQKDKLHCLNDILLEQDIASPFMEKTDLF